MKTCNESRFFSLCDSIAFHNNLTEHIMIVDDVIGKMENKALTQKVNRLADLNKERMAIIEDLENEWKKHTDFDTKMFMGFRR